MPQPTHSISTDQAQTDPTNDVLGYAPFAKYLAKSIVGIAPQNGIVIGIYAPWGSGKTTLLNFVQHYLGEHTESDRPMVIHFNPWWFSGQEDLAKIFFNELLAALGKQEKFKDLKVKIAGYAELLGAIPGYGAAAKEAAKLIKPAEKSISTLKSEIAKALSEASSKILVIIDDIDRLTSEETRQIFRVVKAVADFPNVIYLLAFDRAVAAKALESVHVGDGNAYLEKIVQVPFELPMPDETALQKMLFSRLDAILETDNSETQIEGLFEPSYWANVYREGIYPFIDTPRDVVRMTNTLSVTYPSVRGEVNPVDFIAIETLRVFVPGVYNAIRNNPEMFTGADKVEEYDLKKFKEFHTSWLDTIPKEAKGPTRDLLLRLLPKTSVAWGLSWNRSDNSNRWSRMRRVAHPDVFPIYFRLAPPSNDLSNVRVQQLIGSIKDPKTLCASLVELQTALRPDDASLARRFLERLEDYTDDFPVENIPVAVQGILDAGDTLIANEKEKQNTFWDIGINLQISRVLHQLTHRLPEPERFELLRDAMLATDSYYTVANEVIMMGQEHGKYGSKEREWETTVTSEHLEVLEKVALSKIQSQIKLEDFRGSMRLLRFLHIWKELGSEEQVGDWLREAATDDSGLLTLLTQCLSQVKSQSGDNPILHRTYRLDPFWFKPYIDPSPLRERVIRLASRKDLDERQRVAVLQFLQEFEDRDNGLNPGGVIYTPRRTVYERYAKGLPMDSIDLNHEPSNDE